MGQPVRVLIADDQRSARRGLRALLSLFPQVEIVGEASDGQESVDLVAECQPDVVLLDIHMPTMDGLEAARCIKRRWPKVRVVGLTMYGEYRRPALAAGMDTFLLKGCAIEELEGAILATAR